MPRWCLWTTTEYRCNPTHMVNRQQATTDNIHWDGLQFLYNIPLKHPDDCRHFSAEVACDWIWWHQNETDLSTANSLSATLYIADGSDTRRIFVFPIHTDLLSWLATNHFLDEKGNLDLAKELTWESDMSARNLAQMMWDHEIMPLKGFHLNRWQPLLKMSTDNQLRHDILEVPFHLEDVHD